MASQPFILLVTDDAWQACTLEAGEPVVAEIPFPQGASVVDKAKIVAAALQEIGYAGQGTILALPSSWCYAASISTDDLPPGDRKAMLFRMEEKLPVAAESLIADFVAGPEGSNHALGVSVSIDSIKGWVDALEKAGVAVQSITPKGLLAAQGLPPTGQGDPHVLLCADEGPAGAQLSLISVEASRPTTWALVASDLDDIKFQLNLAMVESALAPHVEACGVPEKLVGAIVDQTSVLIESREESVLVAALQCAAGIAAGRIRPWFELRRGELAIEDPLRLYRKPLNALLASAALVLIVFAGVMFYRGYQYESVVRAADAQVADTFSKQFPGWAIPANVRAVVDSEHRKLGAWTGSALPVQATRSALQTLRDVLERLPFNQHFTIDHANFDEGSFVLDGRLRSYEQLDAMAAAARGAGMTVDPPQARKDAQGYWVFSLRGVRAKEGKDDKETR
jgi:hypothetical protein